MCLLAYLLLRHNISDKGGNSVSVVRRPQPVVAAVVLVLSTSFSLGQQHSSSCCTLDEKFVTYVVFDDKLRCYLNLFSETKQSGYGDSTERTIT